MSQTPDFIPLIALPVAEGAARAAGALVRRNFGRPRPVLERKGHRFITETDHVSERVIATNLRAAYPRCKIVSQEGIKLPQTDDQDNITWWIDPLDGTVNFVHGVPRFCISIGCTDESGKVLVGVIYDPIMDELFAAVKGHGATMNGEPIQVSRVERLRDSLVASSYIDPQMAAPGWAAMAGRVQASMRMGSAALDLCYVAAGRFDGFWDVGLETWDVIAGSLIVEEAGGRVSDYAGNPFDGVSGKQILATNRTIHAEAVEALATALIGDQV